MKHIDFLVWMLGFPLMQAAYDAIKARWCGPQKEYSDGTNGMAALVWILLWIGIGALLW